MSTANTQHYDVIIAGARCAGAATALLLARQGARVLVLDKSRYGTDTLSTHALMRGAVLQLHRWGLLPAVAGAGTPPVRSTTFHLADAVTTMLRRAWPLEPQTRDPETLWVRALRETYAAELRPESGDRALKKIVLRQFHGEGFVNEYALESVTADGKVIEFVTVRIENIAPGWKAKASPKPQCLRGCEIYQWHVNLFSLQAAPLSPANQADAPLDISGITSAVTSFTPHAVIATPDGSKLRCLRQRPCARRALSSCPPAEW